jgi:hypothetical protein
MAGPWEKYGTSGTVPATAGGPWERYAASPPLGRNVMQLTGRVEDLAPYEPTGQQSDNIEDARSAEERHAAALETVRQRHYPNLDDAAWAEFVQSHGAYGLGDLAKDSVMFGLSDELTGLAASLSRGGVFGDGPVAYRDFERLARARRDLGREKEGWLGTGAEIAGGVLSGGPLVKGAMATGSALSRAAKGLGTAGGFGAAYGAGSTDGTASDRLMGAGVGAGLGVAGAAVAPVVVRGAQAVGRNLAHGAATRRAVRAAPMARDIRKGSKAAFAELEATGAIIEQPALNRLRQDVGQFLNDAGLITPRGRVSTAYPKVTDALQSLDDFTSAPLNMKSAQTLHKSFRRVAGSTDPEEARIGGRLLDQFEAWMDNLPPQAFSGGNGQKAAAAWARGKSEWARFRKVQTIELALDRARRAKGGFAAGLRTQFNRILNSDKKRRGFTQAELEAMEKFAEGGPLTKAIELVTAMRGLPGAAAAFSLGGGIPGALTALGGSMAARGALNRSARNVGQRMRADAALPGGLPQRPALPPSRGAALAIGGAGANPLFGDQRNGLAQMFGGGR